MPEPWIIEAGELRHLVTIQSKYAGNPDSRGHQARTWSDLVTGVHAKIETPSGRKLELARQLVPTASHVVTMRYRVLDEQNHRLAFFSTVTTLSSAMDASQRTVVLTTAISIPLGSVIQIGTEQMLVTASATSPTQTTVSVDRAYNGTTAATHAANLNVLKRRLFNIGSIEDVQERNVKIILTCTEAKGPTA